MAGGSLIGKIAKAFHELVTLGWVEDKPVKFFAPRLLDARQFPRR